MKELRWTILILMSVAGCSPVTRPVNPKTLSEGHIFSFEKGAPIPDKLVQIVENQYVEVYRNSHANSELSDVEIITRIPRRLLELSLTLVEKNPGTLVDNTRFVLPAGGGAIDLAEFVNKGKGIFYVDWSLNLEAFELGAESLRVFFVSNGRQFQVGRETYGAGCGRYFEITSFFNKVIREKGLEVAAADKRFLGQLLGTFYFIATNESGVYVAATSFLDTRYPKNHCLPPQMGGAYN